MDLCTRAVGKGGQQRVGTDPEAILVECHKGPGGDFPFTFMNINTKSQQWNWTQSQGCQIIRINECESVSLVSIVWRKSPSFSEVSLIHDWLIVNSELRGNKYLEEQRQKVWNNVNLNPGQWVWKNPLKLCHECLDLTSLKTQNYWTPLTHRL